MVHFIVLQSIPDDLNNKRDTSVGIFDGSTNKASRPPQYNIPKIVPIIYGGGAGKL